MNESKPGPDRLDPEREVVIVVDGGVVQEVYCPDHVNVTVVDLDVEGRGEGAYIRSAVAADGSGPEVLAYVMRYGINTPGGYPDGTLRELKGAMRELVEAEGRRRPGEGLPGQ